ncbi:MAG TPA: alpha/beta hydrolase [Clostridiaceae bacterium]|nr:alpha/beta hydrolase [Clostridiaceae bacterium]
MIVETIGLQEGVSNATLTAYIQDLYDNDSALGEKPAVIICPGGAYLGYTEKEAEPVALRFLAEGFNSFVLRYSVGAGMAKFPAPFIDAAKAVMLIRENARKWNIHPDRICLCGFSVGGHVAATFAATWHEKYLADALNAENVLFKPNALILGYPILDIYRFALRNMERKKEMQPLLEMMLGAVFGCSAPDKDIMDEWNCINRITSHMPKTFLWMTAGDGLVDVDEGLDMVKALAAAGVSYEFHIFQKGVHGMSLWNQPKRHGESLWKESGGLHEWFKLSIQWLLDNGYRR